MDYVDVQIQDRSGVWVTAPHERHNGNPFKYLVGCRVGVSAIGCLNDSASAKRGVLTTRLVFFLLDLLKQLSETRFPAV